MFDRATGWQLALLLKASVVGPSSLARQGAHACFVIFKKFCIFIFCLRRCHCCSRLRSLPAPPRSRLRLTSSTTEHHWLFASELTLYSSLVSLTFWSGTPFLHILINKLATASDARLPATCCQSAEVPADLLCPHCFPFVPLCKEQSSRLLRTSIE